MFAIALRSGPLALDFHHELYPEAKEILAGNNPFPAEGTDLTRGENYVWPPLAALLVSPLTLLPPTVADVAIGLLGLACIGAALWLVGVRDWRVYGATVLWPQVIGEIRISHLTPLLCLLAAIVWRYRDSTVRPGLALGLAWGREVLPLAARSVAARAPERPSRPPCRRRRGRIAPARAPIHGARRVRALDDRPRASVRPGLVFAVRPPRPPRRVGCVGPRRDVRLRRRPARRHVETRSFALAIAASLALAPIVWLDYYALAAVPLAVARRGSRGLAPAAMHVGAAELGNRRGSHLGRRARVGYVHDGLPHHRAR